METDHDPQKDAGSFNLQQQEVRYEEVDGPDCNARLITMGVVQTMVCQLARVLDCPADLKAVAQERNRRTGESFKDYIKLLYDDARIVGTVLDTGLSVNDPLLDLSPGLRLRLFQMDPAIQKLLPQTDSYEAFLKQYLERLNRAVREDKFIGVQAHLAERVGFHARPVSSDEAEKAFAAAMELRKLFGWQPKQPRLRFQKPVRNACSSGTSRIWRPRPSRPGASSSATSAT